MLDEAAEVWTFVDAFDSSPPSDDDDTSVAATTPAATRRGLGNNPDLGTSDSKLNWLILPVGGPFVEMTFATNGTIKGLLAADRILEA